MSFGDMFDDAWPGRYITEEQARYVVGVDPGSTPEMITTFYVDGTGRINQTIRQPRRDNDMKYVNQEAKDLANEILSGRRTEGLRERVEAAVAHLTELFAGAGDGSVFTFAREFDTKTWHYAALKSGGKWFSTGSVTALQAATDDELIAWLIGLEIYEESNLLAIAKTSQPALIEGSVAEDRGHGPDDDQK